MVIIPLPDYYNGSLINPSELNDWLVEKFLCGYLIAKGSFKLSEDVQYPSIPCYIDQGTTVYPLEGEAYLTGPEYLLAKQQGCEFNIKSAFYIHPKHNKTKNDDDDDGFIKPFNGIIKNIQCKRRQYKKGTVEIAHYKEKGNSIYGNVVRGLSNKKSFDVLTGKLFRITGTELSNPILASWTTAFIRYVLGECLHNIKYLGGKIVSVTTDGFITDIENLEDRILPLPE